MKILKGALLLVALLVVFFPRVSLVEKAHAVERGPTLTSGPLAVCFNTTPTRCNVD